MIKVNAMGDACPIPVVKTKNAIAQLQDGGVVEVLVDNEIAVQNLSKMARQKGYEIQSEKVSDGEYRVVLTVGDTSGEVSPLPVTEEASAEGVACIPDARKNIVVAVSSSKMGEGNDELGAILMKSFIFALSQQDELPSTMLFYNGGAKITCEDSPSMEDLKNLEAMGVEIITCGTCLDYYGIKDKLQVGEVGNMYEIVEKMTGAGLVIKP